MTYTTVSLEKNIPGKLMYDMWTQPVGRSDVTLIHRLRQNKVHQLVLIVPPEINRDALEADYIFPVFNRYKEPITAFDGSQLIPMTLMVDKCARNTLSTLNSYGTQLGQRLQNGSNILIQWIGTDRSLASLLICAIAIKTLKIRASKVIQVIQKHIPGTLEKPEHLQLLFALEQIDKERTPFTLKQLDYVLEPGNGLIYQAPIPSPIEDVTGYLEGKSVVILANEEECPFDPTDSSDSLRCSFNKEEIPVDLAVFKGAISILMQNSMSQKPTTVLGKDCRMALLMSVVMSRSSCEVRGLEGLNEKQITFVREQVAPWVN